MNESPALIPDAPLDKRALARQKKEQKAQDDIRRIVHGPLASGVFKLGFPLSIAMLLQATFNLIDMVIIGQLPINAEEAIAALVAGDLIAMVPTILGNGISNAAAALIARRAGEGDIKNASFFTWQSMSLTLALSIVFGLIGVLFSGPIIDNGYEAQGVMREFMMAYIPVILGGSFSILLLLQIAAVLRSLGDGTTPLVLLIGSNVLNLFFAVVLIFGNGPAPAAFAWATPIADALGIAPMGVVGAAWATLAARTLALLLGFVALARKTGAIRFNLRDWLPTKRGWLPLITIAWPNSAQFLLRIAVIEFYHILIVRLFTTATDSATATAYGICVRLETLVLFISMGWGAAASTYVGQNLGVGDQARANRAGWYATLYNLGFVLLSQLLFLFAADWLVNLFLDNPDPRVISVSIDYLHIVGASYLLFGVAIVLSQALTGAGATMTAFGIDLAVLLGIAVPATFLVMGLMDLTEHITWLLVAGGNIVSGLVYIVWYRRGKWLNKVV